LSSSYREIPLLTVAPIRSSSNTRRSRLTSSTHRPFRIHDRTRPPT
jgi:hypothetical protein